VLAPTGGGLVLEHVLGERARSPVQRVLERARERSVVFRCGDQQSVSFLDRAEEFQDRLRGSGLEVFVEGRDARDVVPLHQLDSRREQRARRLEEPAVVGSSAQAAGDTEDPHAA
jgi:hypothetical protein